MQLNPFEAAAFCTAVLVFTWAGTVVAEVIIKHILSKRGKKCATSN